MSAMRRFVWVPAAMIVVSGLAGAAAGCSGSGSAAESGGSGGGGTVMHGSASGAGVGVAQYSLGVLAAPSATGAGSDSQTLRSAATGEKLASDPLRSLPALRSAVTSRSPSATG